MHDRMMKLMMNKKKAGSELSDSEKKSKLEALMGMKDLANSHMGNKLKNLKKVTVASNSPEGLKAGLHKAEDMADQSDDSNLEDSDGEMNKFSKGGKVADGHVMGMPPEFDTDEAEAQKEAAEMAGNDEEHPDNSDEEREEEVPENESHYADGTDDLEMSGEESPESVDQIASDADHLDSQELDELIKLLQHKKASK